MRIPVALVFFTLLTGCREDPEPTQPPPPAKISYSLEIRPWLIQNCLTCHRDLPLQAPDQWNLLHKHREGTKIKTPAFVKLWIEQGPVFDPHWAELPLRNIVANSLDDLIESPGQPLSTKRKKAPPCSPRRSRTSSQAT